MPVLQGFSDLDIQIKGNTDSTLAFEITTKDGFKFYFGKPQTPNAQREAKNKDLSSIPYQLTTSVATFPASSGTVNTWHLIDIVSPSGEKVQFNYELENPRFYRRTYDKKENGIHSSNFSQIIDNQYQLKEIVFNQGKVKFIKKSTEREDLNDGYALASIEVENAYKRVKKYNFNYSYSNNTSSSNINYHLYNNEVQARKRLFLDNIQVVDNANNSELYRGFEYTDKNSLPNRFSNEQDLWGYYNGKNNGPFLASYNYLTYQVSRAVDITKVKVGLIHKMTYPTGGYTIYTFEANQAVVPEYFKELLFADPNPTVQSRYASLRKDTRTRVSYGIYKSSFSVDALDIGPMQVSVRFEGNYGTCSSTANAPYCKYRVSILNGNGQIVQQNGIPLYLYSGTPYTMPLLPVGNYKIRVENVTGVDDPNDFQNSFTVYLNWSKPQYDTPPNEMFSGGNRIQKIENYSVDNGKLTRTYEYKKPDGTNSGLVFSLPNYYYKKKTITLPNGSQVPVIDQYGARPGSPLSYEQGNHVGYSHVTEYIDAGTTKGSGGKTTYEFTAIPDGGKFYEFSYTLAVNNEWLRGKPLKIEHYKRNENASYSIVKKDEFVYSYANELAHNHRILSDPANYKFEEGTPTMQHANDRVKLHRPLITFTYDPYSGVPVGPNNYKVYYLAGGASNLSKKTETNYHDTGNSVSTTSYFYDYNNHYQIARTEVENSLGAIFKTTNEYVKLSNPFRLFPNRTQGYKGSTKLSDQRTIYSFFGSNYLPVRIQTSKGTQALEDRVVYHSYDTKGNPTEVSKKDGTRIVYIWGYNQTQPVAKIENATLAQVSSHITNIQSKSNADNDRTIGTSGNEGALRAALQNLRAAFPSAQITSFTYDPLIGVTSVTDPRGISMYYVYDNLNRLQFVKDKDGNILKEHSYNYKN